MTKGPWKAFRNISAETRQPVQGWHVSGYDWVAMIKLFERHSRTHAEREAAEREVEANARLIAAAPDLLNAAIGLLENIDTFQYEEAKNKLLAAIRSCGIEP